MCSVEFSLCQWSEMNADTNESFGYSGSVAKKANHLGVTPSSLKLPVITSISYSTARSKDWDDVVTTHAGESKGRSWSVEGKRIGKWTMAAEGVSQVCSCFLSRVGDRLLSDDSSTNRQRL